VRRGLASSRAEAQEALRAGLVLVAGSPASKAATLVGEDAAILVRGEVRPFVSRGGSKLRAALDRFELDPARARCLDAGASTGGFTDCLLRAGASHVVAVDVGYGQLAWSLRTDPRVTVMERTNIRTLDPAEVAPPPSFVVADLSFISLRLVIGALVQLATTEAVFVLLVKPQFEVGKDDVGGGVVRDPLVWHRVVDGAAAALRAEGIAPAGVMASPVLGPAGNVEFLLYGRGGETGSAGFGQAGVEAAVREGEELR